MQMIQRILLEFKPGVSQSSAIGMMIWFFSEISRATAAST